MASIHERIVFKQEGLEHRLQYDAALPKSLTDHFYPHDATVEQIVNGQVAELGTFTDAEYDARIRRSTDRAQVQLSASGLVEGCHVNVTKGVTVAAGDATIEIAYLLEGLPQDRDFHFAVDFHLAGLPAGQDDRFFYGQGHDQRLGHLGAWLDLHEQHHFGLIDQWQGLDLQFALDRPTSIWTYPIETVSQSEGGFELVHQSVAVVPHWRVRGDDQGKWSVVIRWTLDTSVARSRTEQQAAAVV